MDHEIRIPNQRLLAALDPRGAESIRFHSKHKQENNIDPDDGNSRLCVACMQPIFSTPFKALESRSGGAARYLHDHCSALPRELEDNDLHPSLEPLRLQLNLHKSRCSKCNAVCGDVLYRCRDQQCDFQLDMICARTVKIVHRSHDHRLTVIRSGADASFACGACGTEHRPGLLWAHPTFLVYVCNACGFWLHPHCATLPNAILLHQHLHPLLLNYGSRSSMRQCAICRDVVASWGVYSCTKCDYYVHIMCAVADNQSFKPVLLREARVPDMVHLPVPDEYTSMIRHITNNTTTTSDDGVPHQHPLTLHHNDPEYIDDVEDGNDDDVHPLPTCNACVQFISPPFYTCSECPKLFLHDCCVRLPRVLAQNPIGIPLLLKGPNKSFMTVAKPSCCDRLTNGFTYYLQLSTTTFSMDVKCALMPASITHAAHAKAHVLRSSYLIKAQTEACRCCGGFLIGVSYKCVTCRNFSIHATCVWLPATVRHVYDRHPLELVTAPPTQGRSQMLICEVCERGLDDRWWYYGCRECDQAFHVDCVPCLDRKSSIKYEITEVRLESCHECPLTLVRGHMVRGRRCGHCGEGYRDRDTLALECFKCYFSIHASCARKIVGIHKNPELIRFYL
ncbi:uncharacterized protein LOC130986334 [Salvia miltiorrhiza]|uniref:uncharacterized protein LOC130986334 n=1 Tax=Salvia miltiorrhiza TaxID=226208 RepID=UPI0025AC9C58|nr:uncharacterized protein LOC130986334 [Salvia miltiorrhiza]